MIMVTDSEAEAEAEADESNATDLNSSINSLPESYTHTCKKKRMKFQVPKIPSRPFQRRNETYKNEIQEIEKINQNEIPLQFRVL